MIKYITYLATALLLISCNPQESDVNRPAVAGQSSYRPPVFSHDERAGRIKRAAGDLQRLIEEHAASHHIPGVAYGVVVDDSLVVAAGTGVIDLEKMTPATAGSAFRIASMTKSFTAMAILKLRDEGRLSLTDPVADHIPVMGDLPYLTSDAPVISIENLLTMTAGFPEDNPWGDRQLDETDEMLTGLFSGGVAFSNVPALQYEYSNTGYALLGQVIEAVAGKPFQEYIIENILLPLGMDHTCWEYTRIPEDVLATGYRREEDQWKAEPMLHDGAFGAMGGLITSIEDFGKYVGYHLSAWPPRNGVEKGPVRRSTLREMHTPRFPLLNTGSSDFDGNPCASMAGYGFGLRISRDCHGMIRVGHGGALPGFGSTYLFYPEYGIGIMAFGNLTYTGPLPVEEIESLLFGTLGLMPRELPASEILLRRQDQLADLIRQGDTTRVTGIMAENFLMDQSWEKRLGTMKELLEKAGAIQEVGVLVPENQLRGGFKMRCEHGILDVFFSLTPEHDPRVQQLDLSFRSR